MSTTIVRKLLGLFRGELNDEELRRRMDEIPYCEVCDYMPVACMCPDGPTFTLRNGTRVEAGRWMGEGQ